MQCQECGENPATLHFTKIINGEKTEMHLCESCAQGKGDFLSDAANSFSIHNLLSGFMNFDPGSGSATATERKSPIRCETCGLTYQQFAKSGRFGCSDCYRHFDGKLEPMFRRIHGNTSHSGKVPVRSGGQIKLKRQLQDLRDEMQRSVEQEEFEKAAQLRDQIKELEQQISNG